MTQIERKCDPRIFDAVFLDMGGVLIHDEAIEARFLWNAYSEIKRADPDITPSHLFSEREKAVARGCLDWLQPYAEGILGSPAWKRVVANSWSNVRGDWHRLAVPIPGAFLTVKALAACTRLALVANQPAEALQTLSRYGLQDSFEVVAIDAFFPYSKPQREIYEWVLGEIRVPRKRVLMVGNRIDHDIIPSAQLGMQTAWIRKIPVPFRVAGVPLAWEQAYFASIAALGKHNQHEFCPAMATVKAYYQAADLASLFDFGKDFELGLVS